MAIRSADRTLAAVQHGVLVLSLFALCGGCRQGSLPSSSGMWEVAPDEVRLSELVSENAPHLSKPELAAKVQQIALEARHRAIDVLRNRLAGFGVSGGTVREAEGTGIMLELPQMSDQARRELDANLLRVGWLEVRMVHEWNRELVDKLLAQSLPPEGYKVTRLDKETLYTRDDSARMAGVPEASARERLGRFRIPDSSCEFMLEEVRVAGATAFRPWFVKRRRELTGESIKDAQVLTNDRGEHIISVMFDARGSKRLAMMIADYSPCGARNPSPTSSRYMAIVVDGEICSVQAIQGMILGGRAALIVSGHFDEARARSLAILLRAGALPVPLRTVHKRRAK